jgi:hypothetical protein
MKTVSFIKDQSELSNAELIASAVKDIALNGMKVLEVKSYPINDKIKKLKKHDFKAYSLNEIMVISMSFGKTGYITVNNDVDVPLVKLRLNNDGPWYFFNKEESIQKVTQMNKLEYDVIKELQDEINASEEYMKDLVENERF